MGWAARPTGWRVPVSEGNGMGAARGGWPGSVAGANARGQVVLAVSLVRLVCVGDCGFRGTQNSDQRLRLSFWAFQFGFTEI
jgi:hypothetical protein